MGGASPGDRLAGCTIGITADRRWQEQARLFEKRGARVLHGPTLRTVDLSHDERLKAATAAVARQPLDYAVVSTGMGFRMWMEAAAGWGMAEAVIEALGRARICARGAKASAAVKAAGLEPWWRAPHETMEEIVEHLSENGAGGTRIAVQLFDPDGHPSTAALRDMASELVEVPVYRWVLPDDTSPARQLVEAAVTGRLDAITFTSQPAVHQLFRIAESASLADELRDACNGRLLAACVGPVCAEAARQEGVERMVWPDPPRLPGMVRQVEDALRPA